MGEGMTMWGAGAVGDTYVYGMSGWVCYGGVVGYVYGGVVGQVYG